MLRPARGPRPLFMIGLFLTPLIAIPGPVHQEAGGHSVERLLRAIPDNAVAVLSTEGWDEIRTRAAQNTWIQFTKDASWKALYELFAELFANNMDLDGIGIDPIEVASSIHGPVALGLTNSQYGWEVCGFIDAGKEGGAFEDFFDLVWNEIEEFSPDRSILEHDGVTALLVHGLGGEMNLALFGVEGAFGFVAHEDPDSIIDRVHEIIDRLKGVEEEDGFLGTNAHDAASRGRPRPPALSVTLNGEVLFHTLSREIDEEALGVITELGFLDIAWAYLNVDIGLGENLDFAAGLHIPRDTVIGDFADLLGPAPIGMLKRLPNTCTSLSFCNYDVAGAWHLLLEVFSSFTQEGYDNVLQGLQSARDLWDIDLEEELVLQFTGDFAGFSMPVPEGEIKNPLERLGIEVDGVPAISTAALTSGDLFNESGGFLAGLADPYTVEDTLEKLLLIAGVSGLVEEEDYQDYTGHSVGLGGQFFMWSFTDDNLVLATSSTPLHNVLSRTEVEVADKSHLSRFHDVLTACGPEVGLVSISDTRTTLESMIGAMGLLAQMLPATPEIPGLHGLSTLELPEKEVVGSYFQGTLIQKISRTRDAVYFTYQAR